MLRYGLLLVVSFLQATFTTTAYSSIYDPDPATGYQYPKTRIQGNLDNFAGEDVVVLFRGVHFLPDQFTEAQSLAYVNSQQVGNGLYSSASYEKANLPYNSNNFEDLKAHSEDVVMDINALYHTDPITIRDRAFSRQRYAFQHLYSNNYQGFHAQMTNPAGEYAPIFENFPYQKNPLLSFSDRIHHPCKYGFGLKNYGAHNPRLPEYNVAGYPRYPYMGKLYGIILDRAAIDEFMPMNVYKAHNAQELILSTHFRNDIFSEREISLPGYVPGENVVFEMPLQAPSFNHAYYPYYEKKYGLTEKRFDNFKTIFTSAGTTNGKRQSKSRELLQGIIESPRQDTKFIYKNCVGYTVNNLFSKALGRIEARMCTLQLDFSMAP